MAEAIEPCRLPRPRGTAVVHTLRFLRDPFSLLADAVRECGDIFSIRLLGFGDWVFLGSPELVRQMFKAPADVLVAGECNSAQLGFMLGLDATFTLDGEAHRRRQRLVHPHLNGRRTHQHIPAMREIALGALSRWPVGRPFAFLPQAHRISLDVMVHAIFGASGPERVYELASIFETFASRGLRSLLIAMPYLQVDLGRFSPWGKILEMRRAVVEAFSAEIARRIERREEEEATDILSELARTKQPDGEYLSPGSLSDEVINLLFAGHETTGNVLTWTMETLHSHPEVLARVRAELETVLQGEPVEASHLGELSSLDAAIQETIRFRPLAPMAGVRLVKEPFEIGGYLIPEGMLVTQGFPVMANREDVFPHPACFDTGHFHDRKLKAFEWNPFGGGTRMCIGRGLAEVELKVVLATLLQHAEFRLGQESARPVRHGLFFSPDKGLRVMMEKRCG